MRTGTGIAIAAAVAVVTTAIAVASSSSDAIASPPPSPWKRVTAEEGTGILWVPAGAKFRVSVGDDGTGLGASYFDDLGKNAAVAIFKPITTQVPADWPPDDPYRRANRGEGTAKDRFGITGTMIAVWVLA